MSLGIVHYNDPVLRMKGGKVTAFDAEIASFADLMINAMHEAHGIGLAAQQVGRAVQMCVIDLRETEADFDWLIDGKKTPLGVFMPMVLVNPKVTIPKDTESEPSEEGCLSFPEIRADVVRATEIHAKFQDAYGHPHVLECNGLFARCVLHEVDHLNGVLFIDRMDKVAKASIKEAVDELAKQTKAAKSAKP
ncbi:MAG TPA: peptide deformylase [Opitutaceae bacterium]|nr:peptide deformylase [Opitutaceae bacterium]